MSPAQALDVNGTVKAAAFQSATGQPFKILSGTASINVSGTGPAGLTSQAVNFGYTFTSAPKVMLTSTTWGSWCNGTTGTPFGTTTTGFNIGVTFLVNGTISATCTYDWVAIGN